MPSYVKKKQRAQNKDKSISEFDFQLNKMSLSGALFDMVKLLDVSKSVISNTILSISSVSGGVFSIL